MARRGQVLWLMGPTSAGKTTISEILSAKMAAAGFGIMHYDGDEVRDLIGPAHGFSTEDRLRTVRTLTYLANKAADAGLNVIVSALTANQNARDHIAKSIGNLLVGYVKCSINTCADRDPKGLYAQAAKGEIDTLIGINSEYLAPETPDLVLDTEKLSAETAAETAFQFWRKRLA